MVTLTPEGSVESETLLSGQEVARAQWFLNDSPYLQLRSVVCQRHGNVLVLRGRVESFHLKQLAQETVRRLAPDQVIANLLTVD
jgi:hypothetical protein